jgi:hypothetical protein
MGEEGWIMAKLTQEELEEIKSRYKQVIERYIGLKAMQFECETDEQVETLDVQYTASPILTIRW